MRFIVVYSKKKKKKLLSARVAVPISHILTVYHSTFLDECKVKLLVAK